jgi:hypothetical protein
MNPLRGTLREDELDLVRETEPERMQRLDEDALLDLHTRIRRAHEVRQALSARGQRSSAVGRWEGPGPAEESAERGQGRGV